MSHPVAEFTSPSTWSFIESKFTPYGKETLAKVVDFVQNECLPGMRVHFNYKPANN
ncbi:hypothetical protein RSAG8_06449, partial [Rhizoctonia solani AG-8 WAC10335]